MSLHTRTRIESLWKKTAPWLAACLLAACASSTPAPISSIKPVTRPTAQVTPTAAPKAPPRGSSAVAVAKPIQTPVFQQQAPAGTSTAMPTGAPALKTEPLGGTRSHAPTVPPVAALAPAASTPPSAARPPAQPPAATGKWQWPASGPVIRRFDPSRAKGGDIMAKGIDIEGKKGDPVVAAAGGKVAYAGSGLRGYGKFILIQHAGKYLTAYAHNSKLLVKEGDIITAGQKIAEIGDTDSNRAKLHFELRRDGKPINPEAYLPKR